MSPPQVKDAAVKFQQGQADRGGSALNSVHDRAAMQAGAESGAIGKWFTV